MNEHDVIVIGLGVGGEQVAGSLSEAGMDVLGIERKLVGGECPYWGCVPTKMMVRAANALVETQRVERLAGVAHAHPDYGPVAQRIREQATDNWNDQVAVDRLRDKGGTFLRGDARFVDGKTVEVDGERHVARRGIVIATGTEPAIPPIEGLDDVDFWTNRDAVATKEVPESIVVLGAGPIGLELGQVFRRFGSEVSFVELFDHALAFDEPEIGDAVSKVLHDEGMTLRTRTSAESVARSGDGVAVKLSDGSTLEAERLLVATGRRSNLDIGLEVTGLDADAKTLSVDGHLRAGNGLWAVGDITGYGQFTHVAVYQARVAIEDILGRDHPPADYRAVPRVTFLDPEVAAVGMTAQRAHERGIRVRTGTAATASSARGWIHGPGAEYGVAKLVADADRDVLVGASVMGPAAGEVIGILVLAIKERIPLPALRDLIYPYPTFVRGIEDALAQVAN